MARRSISPFERYGIATPNADASLRVHVFSLGDTISKLADKYYEDWRLWRVIADRNDIADVRKIAYGTTLLVPPRPLEPGRYESG
jgi:nucleoid-associated protein YgaU